MSIIHDALKKVQIFRRKPSNNPDGGPQPPSEEKEKPKFNPLMALFALLLLGAALYFGYGQLLKHWDRIRMAFDLPNIKLQKIELPKVSISTGANDEKKPKTLSENRTPVPIAQIDTATDQKLNIQGVMSQDGHTVVLINDKIYEEGDVLGNVTIKTIDSTGVTIVKDGIEEHIRVRP